jgi:hypothetical protein
MGSRLAKPMNDSEKRLESAFRHCLKDFKSDEEAFENGYWGEEQLVNFSSSKTPLPSTVFISLVGIAGFKCWGKSEKILWEIPIKYKSFPFLLSHRKFGFRVHCKKEKLPPPNLAEEMIEQLNKAIMIADKLAQPLVEQQVRAGNVTVANHYVKLDMMYRFFRKKAKEAFSHPAPKPKIVNRDENGEPVGWFHDPMKPDREGFYYTIAMLDAFFSRLEHLLILVLPFVGFDCSKEDMPIIMSANWTDKYKRVFNLASNSKAKTLFAELRSVKERYRNAIAHGYFEKEGASLFFHFGGIYAVPVTLSDFQDSIQYSFLPITYKSYKDICSLFDEVDAFLKSGPAKYGVRFAESGLNVAFDARSLSEYRLASKSDIEFKEFVEYMAHTDAIQTNMDW